MIGLVCARGGHLSKYFFRANQHSHKVTERSASIIAACIEGSQYIGRDGGLPWQPPFGPGLPAELKHFVDTTHNGILIVGRRTFEERGVPYNHASHTIVITRDMDGKIQNSGAIVAESLDEALVIGRDILRKDVVPGESGESTQNDCDTVDIYEPIWICGGKRVFDEAIKRQLASKLVLTIVHEDFTGDVTFTDRQIWQRAFQVELEHPRVKTENDIKYTIHTRSTYRHWLNVPLDDEENFIVAVDSSKTGNNND